MRKKINLLYLLTDVCTTFEFGSKSNTCGVVGSLYIHSAREASGEFLTNYKFVDIHDYNSPIQRKS